MSCIEYQILFRRQQLNIANINDPITPAEKCKYVLIVLAYKVNTLFDH